MKRLFLIGLTLATSLSFGAVLVQGDFTPAQSGTLPTEFSGSYDGGTDVAVRPLADFSPAISGDHTGGDGYACRVGDIGSGGGAYNWAYLTSAAAAGDQRLTAWVYISDANMDTPAAAERDYMMLARMQNTNPQTAITGGYSREAYFFAVTYNSSWSGMPAPVPANAMPILFKRDGTGNHTRLWEGTTAVANGWHRLSIQCVGTTIKGFVDGAEVCSVTDTTFSTGKAAIGYYEDNGSLVSYPYSAAYDNFLWESQVADVQDWSMY